MPMYDYVCLDCHNQFERIRSSSEADAPQPCPSCKGERVKRRIAVVASFARDKTGATQSQMQGGCGCGGACSCGSHRLN